MGHHPVQPAAGLIRHAAGAIEAAPVERYDEWATETPEERRISKEGVVGVQADEFVARGVHEGDIEDAERFAEDT